jgi:hypothetical protein
MVEFREPLYTEDSWRLCVIMNLVAIRVVMFELCCLVSGAAVFYFYEIGAADARMAASVAVCGGTLMGYLTEKKRHGRLQDLYDRLPLD